MKANDRVIRRDHGVWAPPRRLGANSIVSSPGLDQGDAFFFDGETTKVVPLPAHLEAHPFQCYSLYINDQAGIRIVPYDATSFQVYDGNDTGAYHPTDDDAGSEPPQRSDWKALSFYDKSNNQEIISYADYNANRENLVAHRRNQEWVQQIIPQRHIGPNMVKKQPCGLSGQVALVIGLLTFSLPKDRAHEILHHLVAKTWRTLPPQVVSGPLARTNMPRRGVRVTVWLNIPRPPSSPTPETLALYRNIFTALETQMERYQNGDFGLYFD